jgi:hypothetical protein
MTISTEQFITVNVGASANDGTGDSLREAFIKLNDNFSNIGDVGFDSGNINVVGAIEVTGNIETSTNLVANAIYVDNFFLSNGDLPMANYPGNIGIAGTLTIANVYVPTANTSVGTAGQIVWDSGYLYVCIAANTWKRANISTW